MERAVELAGFFAAHGVWCIADGEALTPMLAHESADDERGLFRFDAEHVDDGIAEAHAHLETNPDDVARAVMVYDGWLELPGGRTDALFVIVRDYAAPETTLSMAIPYRPAASADGFAVHRPKFVDWHGADEPDYAAFGAAFYRGVGAHAEAAAVWAEHADESV